MPTTSANKQELQGYFLMFGSILIFSLLPYYIQFLAPVDGNTLFSFRVLSQLGFGFLFLVLTRQLFALKSVFVQPKELLLLCFTSPLIAIQWWIFFWGPVNGETINIAMGYFLLPITISLTGRFYFKENLSPLLWLAVSAALIGVSVELYRSHSFSWVTLLICLAYPPYFILRRKSKIPTTSNFVAENIFCHPDSFVVAVLCEPAAIALFAFFRLGSIIVIRLRFIGHCCHAVFCFCINTVKIYYIWYVKLW